MNLEHVRALTAVEIRRAVPAVVRLHLLGAGALVLLVVFGAGAGEKIVGVVAGVTIGTVVATTPFALMRDKLDRTLEFMLSLPVRPADLALARFLAVAACALPGSLAVGVAFAIVSPSAAELGPLLAAAAPWQAALACWAAVTLCGWCIIAAMAVDATRLISAMFLGAVLFVIFVEPRISDLTTRIWEALAALMQRPYARAAIWGAVLAAAAAVALAAFAVAHRGIARHEHRPDKPI